MNKFNHPFFANADSRGTAYNQAMSQGNVAAAMVMRGGSATASAPKCKTGEVLDKKTNKCIKAPTTSSSTKTTHTTVTQNTNTAVVPAKKNTAQVVTVPAKKTDTKVVVQGATPTPDKNGK